MVLGRPSIVRWDYHSLKCTPTPCARQHDQHKEDLEPDRGHRKASEGNAL